MNGVSAVRLQMVIAVSSHYFFHYLEPPQPSHKHADFSFMCTAACPSKRPYREENGAKEVRMRLSRSRRT